MEVKLNAIEDIYGISSILYDRHGKVLLSSSKIKDNCYFHWIKNKQIDLSAISIIIHTSRIGVAIIPLKESFLVLGNVFVGERNERRLLEIKQQITKEEEAYFHQLKEISLSQLKKLCLLIAQWENGRDSNIVIVEEEKQTEKFLKIDNKEEYGIVENHHLIEQMMLCIQYGQVEDLKRIIHYEFKSPETKSLEKKKTEFIQLSSFVSLSLFKGGLGVYESHAFKDYYLNKIQTITIEEELHQLQNELLESAAYAISQRQFDNISHPLIRKAHRYLQAHLHESVDFMLMAESLGVSKNYLLTQFKKETGKSLVDYVYQLKIKEAVFLLHQNELTVTQIAAYLGFSSSSYFITWFKKIKGMTPKEYINKK